MTLSTQDRITSSIVVVEDCWHWTGPLNQGYGIISVNNRKRRAHRVSYEAFRGPIPKGLVIDHLCRRRDCVNPWHFEVVTDRTNILRGEGVAATNSKKTVCRRGHLLSGSNLSIQTKKGRPARVCRECNKLACAEFRALNRLEQP